jgi:phosphatidylethanolamine-binding protein (PEBP) family uncharacterized protein
LEMPMHRAAAITGVITALVTVAMADLAFAMSLDFSWAGVAGCASKPPAFRLSDVPSGTSQLAFNMVDLDLPSFPHGGGTIDYHGGDKLAAGSFTYQGPCPPKGQRHNYRWTVKALDAAGKTLATTSAAKQFPPR